MPSFEIQIIALVAVVLFIHLLRLALEAQTEAQILQEIEAAIKAHTCWIDGFRLPVNVAFEIGFLGYAVSQRSTPVYGEYHLGYPQNIIQFYNWEDQKWTSLSWDTQDILKVVNSQLVSGFDLLVAVNGIEFFLVEDSDAIHKPQRRVVRGEWDGRYKRTRLIGG
jgi:hypothetical protein